MPRLSDNMRAAVFMMLSMAGFAFNDAMIKLSSSDLALFQAIFLRGLFATALITLLALRMGAFRHRPGRRDRRIVALRSVAEVGSTFFFLGALFNMPIADATAILQSLPLAVTLAAAFVFGERVGWRRYAAILVGFGGVLIIVRPGGAAFTPYAFWHSAPSSGSSCATSRPGGCRRTCRRSRSRSTPRRRSRSRPA
jgi:drug/metabolite transporter (DMT)-like permease